MAKVHETWKVLPHGPIEKLGSRVWRVEGNLEGMPLKRVMTLARCSDGSVVVHNAIALEDELMQQIEAWGAPSHLIVPNGYHRLDAKIFKQRYPKLRVYAPSGARRKVEEVVGVDGTYEDFPKDDAVSLIPLAGSAAREGVMQVKDSDGVTLVFNDMLFNMPHLSGMQGFVLKHVTQSTGGPRISRIGRFFLMKDKRALCEHLRQLADTPDLERIIVSHHEVISDDPAGTLRRVVDAL